jgi:hypothetical protein
MPPIRAYRNGLDSPLSGMGRVASGSIQDSSKNLLMVDTL